MRAMDYGINQLSGIDSQGCRYHLYDRENKLRLVADQGSPWLPEDAHQQVRFARPDADLVASLDLPWTEPKAKNGRQHIAYAIILDHAVHAIINRYQHLDEESGAKTGPPYFVLEMDGLNWLALRQPEEPPYVAIYDEVPSNLGIYNEPLQAELPTPVGKVEQVTVSYQFAVTLPVHRLTRPALIALALVFLVEQNVPA